MKRLVSLAVAGATVALLSGVVLADPPGRGWMMGGGSQAMGPGMMRPEMMGMPMLQGRMAGGDPGACPGFMAAAAPGAGSAISEDEAKKLATEYAGKYLSGFTVERVLPFAGRFHTAYQVELKGPKGETRTLHVNPWGGVRPF